MMALTDSSAIAVARADHGEPASETCHIWCLSELDPLTLTPYLDAMHSRNITKDPMFEEFTASLASSRIIAWPSVERLSSPPVPPSYKMRPWQ